MIFFVGSRINQATIASSMGRPEYSYYFLLKDFLPALEQLGQVVQVNSIDEIKHLTRQYEVAGERVVLFSFTPPSHTPLDMPCPTVCVFAWEFTSLPSIAPDLAAQAQPGQWHADPRNDWYHVFSQLQGVIATSTEVANLVRESDATSAVAALPAPIWSRFAGQCPEQGFRRRKQKRRMSFIGQVLDSEHLGLKPEHALPQLGSEAKRLHRALLDGWKYEIRLPRRTTTVSKPAPKKTELSLSGVVYTSVFNPVDGRKNWRDILSSFCWVFRDEPNATLILKITHNDLTHFRNVMINAMARSAPFRCRVIVLQAFLDDQQYQELIQASDYYVNASSGEGLCIPLMEFLSCGRPAIAPKHSAMADYIRPQCSFIVESSLELGDWPQDPSGQMSTYRRRIHWQSLAEQFSASYAQGNASEAYQAMSMSACQGLRAYCSLEAVLPQLKSFVEQVFEESLV